MHRRNAASEILAVGQIAGDRKQIVCAARGELRKRGEIGAVGQPAHSTAQENIEFPRAVDREEGVAFPMERGVNVQGLVKTVEEKGEEDDGQECGEPVKEDAGAREEISREEGGGRGPKGQADKVEVPDIEGDKRP